MLSSMLPTAVLILVVLLAVIPHTIGTVLYSITNNKIFLYLNNNELVSLDFNINGDFSLNNEAIDTLLTPPEGTSLFLVHDELYGMNENDDEMNLIKYNNDKNSWNTVALNFDDISDTRFYNQSSYLTSPGSDEIYIYGGIRDGEVTDRMVSLDFNKFKFSNISTSTKPHAFYGASNLLAPDPQTQLLIGGASSDDNWLNMYQLATWDFESGWSFQSVTSTTASVESRINSIALPIFNKLVNSSEAEVMTNYRVSRILLLGGESDNGKSDTDLVYLNLTTNDWKYEVANNTGDFDVSDYLGVATIFENIITISEEKTKRDSNYKIDIFDLNFNKLDKLSIPSTSTNSNKIKQSIQKKAILGTVLPICAIIAIVSGGYFFMKKRKEIQLAQELNDLNYHFENCYNKEEDFNVNQNRLVFNDSNSTLEVNSIDSWVKKRQEYERKNFMHSQETLDDTSEDIVEPPSPLKTITKLNRSMLRLKKSISFNNLPSPEKRSYLLNDDEAKIENMTPISPSKSILNKPTSNLTDDANLVHNDYDDYDDYESDHSLDDIDVQVLVSSKRRSTLKVVNPDVALSLRLETLESLKYRKPSNESETTVL